MKRFFSRLLAIDWLGMPRGLVRSWRRSLQFRAVTYSVVLSGFAIAVVGVYMSVSISNDLFSSRLSEVLAQSQRAQDAAQRIYDSSVATDRASVANLLNTSLSSIRDASASSLVAFYRDPASPPNSLTPQDFLSPDLAGLSVSPLLQRSVQHGNGSQFWQSVELPPSSTDASAEPGVLVGSTVTIPTVGTFDLYIGYSFAEAQSTLNAVTRVLWLSGLGLLLLIGGIAWFIARLVVKPIRVTAQTSQKIASGDLSARVPELGDDVITLLARNFNAMARSMQKQVTSLEDLSSMQRQFVLDVSHELKTPLTVLQLAGDVIYEKRDQLDAPGRKSAEQLHANLSRFEGLLGELIEISRYDAGTVELALEPTNVATLVNEVVAGLEPVAKEYGSSVEVRLPGNAGEAIIDPRRVRRIIFNLLGNAIEHGEGKPILVDIASSKDAVAIVVDDHGVGMTEQQLEQVFNRFYRADPARKRTIGGTGLGLSIALQDAKIHNGYIDAWASPGAGSRFRLTLPRKPSLGWRASPATLAREEVSADAH